MMKWSEFVEWLGGMDEAWSKPVFESSLPKPIEAVFSIPANWFGLGPILLVGPLWTGWMVDTKGDNFNLLAASLITSIPFLVIWGRYLYTNHKASGKIFGGMSGYLYGPLVSIYLCYYLMDDRQLYAKAVYTLLLWIPSLVLVLIAKAQAQRHRPCCKPKYQPLIERKQFPNIPILLADIAAQGSLPSGDAAGAMAFAIVFILDGQTVLGLSIAMLACLGRLYFLAHHALDTIAGCLCTMVVHGIWYYVLGGNFATLELSWWQPLLVHLTFILFSATVGKKISNRK